MFLWWVDAKAIQDIDYRSVAIQWNTVSRLWPWIYTRDLTHHAKILSDKHVDDNIAFSQKSYHRGAVAGLKYEGMYAFKIWSPLIFQCFSEGTAGASGLKGNFLLRITIAICHFEFRLRWRFVWTGGDTGRNVEVVAGSACARNLATQIAWVVPAFSLQTALRNDPASDKPSVMQHAARLRWSSVWSREQNSWSGAEQSIVTTHKHCSHSNDA